MWEGLCASVRVGRLEVSLGGCGLALATRFAQVNSLLTESSIKIIFIKIGTALLHIDIGTELVLEWI